MVNGERGNVQRAMRNGQRATGNEVSVRNGQQGAKIHFPNLNPNLNCNPRLGIVSLAVYSCC